MPRKRSAVNPFYVLLIGLGIAFAITASAYSVMTLKAVRPPSVAENTTGGTALLEFLDRHGGQLMASELALLAVATLGAIATDRYWMRRAYDEYRVRQPEQPPDEP
jgi:hypothetical protein